MSAPYRKSTPYRSNSFYRGVAPSPVIYTVDLPRRKNTRMKSAAKAPVETVSAITIT